MLTNLATTKGAMTDNLIEHYVRRSKALGLQIIEHSYVSLNGKLSERQLGIYDDGLIPGLERLSRSVHESGTLVVVQINHAGARSSEKITGLTSVAPSPSENTRELQGEEIEAVIIAFETATERAIKAGFDGVEVHGAHGFLLHQFFSPLTNKRQDRYGGSLENRIRFPLEVIKRVKEKVGGKLLLFRLGSVDLEPEGIKIEDAKKFALKLEDAGVDIIDVSGGLCGSRPDQLQDKQGYFIPQAQKIKEVVGIPIIGVGGITESKYADNTIREEKVDLVAVGRSLLKDTDWAVKAVNTLKS